MTSLSPVSGGDRSSFRGLDYPGSETVVRTADGICSTSPSKSVLPGLVNYPVLLTVTRAAFEKIARTFLEDKTGPSITVKAESSDGKLHPLFTIDKSLFARVRNRAHSDKPKQTFEVGTFVNSQEAYSYSTKVCDRAPSSKHLPMLQEIKGFQADFLSGSESKTCRFLPLPVDCFPEILDLTIDVFSDGWKLMLEQKSGVPKTEEAALFQERMKSVSRKTLYPDMCCPITGRILQEPVQIPRGEEFLKSLGKVNWYEKQALVDWADTRSNEPLPKPKSEVDRLLKKAQDLSTKVEAEGPELTSELQKEILRLELMLELKDLLPTTKKIPADISGKERLRWITDFLQAEHEALNAEKKSIFVNKTDVEQAKIDLFIQNISRLFMATHTNY